MSSTLSAIENAMGPAEWQGSSRAELLRAIERLRVGLPPSTAGTRISIGAEKVASSLDQLLQRSGNCGLFVLGNYGEGKSHALTLLRDRALLGGYATCWLTADAYESALNHPQRFIAGLLGTLESPQGDAGYSAMIARLLATATLRESVVTKVAGTLNGSSSLDLSGRSVLSSLIMSSVGMEDRDEACQRADALARLLSGESLTGMSNLESYRRMAYRLLGLAERLAVTGGCRGLVIVIDEVESVVTKLWNVRSRFGAYRMLSALCMGMGEARIKVAMAVTPDSLTAMASELGGAAGYIVSSPFEPVERFRRALEAGAIPAVRCISPSGAQLGELLWRVRALYRQAYPGTPLGSVEEWANTVRSILSRQPPVRIAVRDGIDALDRIRILSDRGA